MERHTPAGETPTLHFRSPKKIIIWYTAMDNHPVVHISFEDAEAYAKWAGKRLPTKAKWEFVVRGGKSGELHPWGNNPPTEGSLKVNIFEGTFLLKNSTRDGRVLAATVKSDPLNACGFSTCWNLFGNGAPTCIARMPTPSAPVTSRSLTHKVPRQVSIPRRPAPPNTLDAYSNTFNAICRNERDLL